MSKISIRVDGNTYEILVRLAAALGTTVDEAASIAIRRLQQQLIGRQLNSPLTQDEMAWLKADLS